MEKERVSPSLSFWTLIQQNRQALFQKKMQKRAQRLLSSLYEALIDDCHSSLSFVKCSSHVDADEIKYVRNQGLILGGTRSENVMDGSGAAM